MAAELLILTQVAVLCSTLHVVYCFAYTHCHVSITDGDVKFLHRVAFTDMCLLMVLFIVNKCCVIVFTVVPALT